ncbi:MAG: hypothetical protein ACP5E3_17440, partial [Bacteroidales bacterium]
MDRRKFIRNSMVAGAALSLPVNVFSRPLQKESASIGFIGVGLRGCNHLNNLLQRKDIRIPAICDIDPGRIDIAQKMITDAGYKPAEVYTGDNYAYRDLLAREDIDGVIISTPWLWHT